MEVDLDTYIERAIISQDAGFIAGLLMSVSKLEDKDGIPFLLSCIDFASLIVFEASAYYSRSDNAMQSRLRTNYSDIIKQSRQRMKLFDDRALGIEGIGGMFMNVLTPSHQRELSKDHLIPLPKWMWADIGIYIDEASGLPVGTTHLASFNSGVTNPRDFFSAQVSHGIGEHLGSFLALFAKRIELINADNVSILSKDMRSEQIYSTKNYGSTETSINAGLSVIGMRMNFLGTLLSRGMQSPSIFKWKFLSIFHAISSLDSFSRLSHFNMLAASHKKAIEVVLKSDIASLMLSGEAVPLRNTLTHNGLDTRLDKIKLNSNSDQLFGLVEASFTDWRYKELEDFINDQLAGILMDMFGTWRK